MRASEFGNVVQTSARRSINVRFKGLGCNMQRRDEGGEGPQCSSIKISSEFPSIPTESKHCGRCLRVRWHGFYNAAVFSAGGCQSHVQDEVSATRARLGIVICRYAGIPLTQRPTAVQMGQCVGVHGDDAEGRFAARPFAASGPTRPVPRAAHWARNVKGKVTLACGPYFTWRRTIWTGALVSDNKLFPSGARFVAQVGRSAATKLRSSGRCVEEISTIGVKYLERRLRRVGPAGLAFDLELSLIA